MTGTDIDEIPSYPCPICRALCHPFVGVFADGRWYHERCYVHHIGEEVNRLQKKVNRGTITLEEAEELRSLEPMYKNMRQPKKEMDIRKYKEPPKFKGNTQIALLSSTSRTPKKQITKKLQQSQNIKLIDKNPAPVRADEPLDIGLGD